MPTSDDRLAAVVSMKCFDEVLKAIVRADHTQGTAIETALRKALAESHQALQEDSPSSDHLRYWLYREAVELKAQAASFLNYEREMARREAALWRFALERHEQFFALVIEALDEYFNAKANVILRDVEADARWYTGLRDHAKKGAIVVKPLAKASNWLLDRVQQSRVLDDTAAAPTLKKATGLTENVAELDTRDVVTRAIESHLSASILARDVQAILTEAGQRLEKAWNEQLKEQAPDLDALNLFSAGAMGGPAITFAFDLGAAEYTLIAGLGGAIAGTLSLAAGWHVLAYAMVNVFAPAAAIAAVATVGAAVLSRDRDLERRRRKVRDAIDQYHRHFLVMLDTARLEPLGGKTLREAMSAQIKTLVTSTIRSWEKAISGDLTVDHYRALGLACTAHLQLIQECMDHLDDLSTRRAEEERSTPRT